MILATVWQESYSIYSHLSAISTDCIHCSPPSRRLGRLLPAWAIPQQGLRKHSELVLLFLLLSILKI